MEPLERLHRLRLIGGVGGFPADRYDVVPDPPDLVSGRDHPWQVPGLVRFRQLTPDHELHLVAGWGGRDDERVFRRVNVDPPRGECRGEKAFSGAVAGADSDVGRVNDRGRDLLLFRPQVDAEPFFRPPDRVGAVPVRVEAPTDTRRGAAVEHVDRRWCGGRGHQRSCFPHAQHSRPTPPPARTQSCPTSRHMIRATVRRVKR